MPSAVFILFFVRPFLKSGNHGADNILRQTLSGTVNQSILDAVVLFFIGLQNDVGNFWFFLTALGIIHKQLFGIIAKDISDISAGVMTHLKMVLSAS